jgi:hypothetical protein
MMEIEDCESTAESTPNQPLPIGMMPSKLYEISRQWSNNIQNEGDERIRIAENPNRKRPLCQKCQNETQ